MRAHFGGYFFGQVATFMYLLQSMSQSEQFDPMTWPQFSVYNLVVANFWPLYWFGRLLDPEKLDTAYWHVYDVAQARVADVLALVQMFMGSTGTT
jgi:hypothetical protein